MQTRNRQISLEKTLVPRQACAGGTSGTTGTIGEMSATSPATKPRGAGPLRPGELAQSAVMAALCAATEIIAIVVPFAGALSLLGMVPMGLLAYRYRIRVLIAATVAAGMIAFLIAGLGGLMAVVHSAYIGGLTGIVKRKHRGTRTVLVASFAAGVALGAVS